MKLRFVWGEPIAPELTKRGILQEELGSFLEALVSNADVPPESDFRPEAYQAIFSYLQHEGVLTESGEIIPEGLSHLDKRRRLQGIPEQPTLAERPLTPFDVVLADLQAEVELNRYREKNPHFY